MENGIKVWHAVVATFTLIMSIVGTIVIFTSKVETQRIRIEFLESNMRDHSIQIKDLNQKQTEQYKEINSKMTDILILLQNKENKK